MRHELKLELSQGTLTFQTFQYPYNKGFDGRVEIDFVETLSKRGKMKFVTLTAMPERGFYWAIPTSGILQPVFSTGRGNILILGANGSYSYRTCLFGDKIGEPEPKAEDIQELTFVEKEWGAERLRGWPN